MCDLRPACRRNCGCKKTLSMGEAEAHMRESRACRAAGMCQQGCGSLLHEDLVRGHRCCLSTLRAQNGVLRAQLAHLDLEAEEQKVRWAGRERYLLAQLRGMRREARLAALRYRHRLHRLHQYMLLIRKGGDEAHVSLSLPRNKDSLAINEMSTRSCQKNAGPEISSRGLQV